MSDQAVQNIMTQYFALATGGNDPEIDAINICVEALAGIQDINARARAAQYLLERFGACTGQTQPE